MSATMHGAVQIMSKLLADENQALMDMDFARAGSLLAPKHAAADSLAAAWRAATPSDVPAAELLKLGELAEENRPPLEPRHARAAPRARSGGKGGAQRPSAATIWCGRPRGRPDELSPQPADTYLNQDRAQ